MNRESLTKAAVFGALVTLAVVVRLVSETPNFGAVTAATLFAGFYFTHRTTAFCVPLVIMTISDSFLGGYSKPMMVAVYGSFLLPVAFRSLLRVKLNPLRVGSSAVASSVAFYLITNGVVWTLWYPKTWVGVMDCYGRALPFFGNTLLSDVIFAAGFFGLYALASRTSEATARVLPARA